MKKTVLFLSLVFLLCALFVKPDCMPQMIRAAETAKETAAQTQWKTDAIENGADLYTFDEDLYYSETDPAHIVSVSDAFAYVDNEVIVYFKDNVSLKEKKALFDELNASVVGCADVIHKYQLQLPEKKSFSALQALCLKLQSKKEVVFASCNLARHLHEDAVPDDPWMEPSGYPAAPSWDETFFRGGNWWLTATQTTSAWDYASYFHPINIGIIDSGFDTAHEDLQNKFIFPSKYFERSNHPSSHGTHVSGIISANANNQIGITGICDNAKLWCVDWSPVEDEQYWSTDERIFTGAISLIKHGAKVINLSVGSSGGYEEKNKFWTTFCLNLEAAVYSYMMASMLRRGYDFIFVQSAGNGNHDGDPCDCFFNGAFSSITKKNIFTGLTGIPKQAILDRIIVVGSMTSAHDKTEFYQSSFSNYGSMVSIFAPGSHVFSTDTAEYENYSYKSGTSMAAPVVTGITALTWSVNPKLTGAEVKAIVCDPANTIYTAVNYYNDTMEIPSYPVINAKLAVQAAIRTLPESEWPSEPATDPTEPEAEIVMDPPIIVHPTIPHYPVQASADAPILTDRSDKEWIERFRGEIGE